MPNRPISPDHSPIAVTGLGLLSPLGTSAWSTLRALRDGRTLCERTAALPEQVDPVDLVRAIGIIASCIHDPIDPALSAAEQAARQALLDAGCPAQRGRPGFDGLVLLAVSKGAMHALTRLVASRDRQAGVDDHDLARLLTLGPTGYLAAHLEARLGLPVDRTIVSACSSSLIAVDVARRAMLAPGGPQRALIVTSEAALLPQFIHSYRRLGVLPRLEPATYQARPLDRKRQGFVLAELAAAVVLDRSPCPDVKPVARLLDTAIACESSDLIRPDPRMPALRHVAQRLFTGRTIDLIHPHATGTPDHDPTELSVLHQVLAQTQPDAPLPDVYAAKGAVGHGLGAAGLVSFVLACLSAKTGQRLPMPWLRDPVDSPFPLQDVPPTRRPSTQAVFAAGFGGHTAGAIIGAA